MRDSSRAFARAHSSREALPVPAGSSYVYSPGIEDRSLVPEPWRVTQTTAGVNFVLITEDHSAQGTFSFHVQETGKTVGLRSERELASFVNELPDGPVYVDITGQYSATWAGILRACLRAKRECVVVYAEPKEYRYNTAPIEGEIFDLSERITGLEPIPGFARLAGAADDAPLIALLGFEGPRFAFLVEQLEPPNDRIYPVVGIPGYRIEYPFFTYWCNKATLLNTRSWTRVRYARADCPFSVYRALADIVAENVGKAIRIAPIGTKPHALGAVLYCLAATARGASVELVYDHPIRKSKRTEGTGPIRTYLVSAFLEAHGS